MEKYFGNAYRGDPGVPHADPDRFVNIWIGSIAFSALTWVNPYMWQLSNQFKYSLNFCVVAEKIRELINEFWKIYWIFVSQTMENSVSSMHCSAEWNILFSWMWIMDCLFSGVPSWALGFLFLHVLFFLNYHRLKYYLFADNIE